MPVYVYRRPDGSVFEIKQHMTDKPLETDPETGVPVTRLIVSSKFILKSDGFYATDNGRKPQVELE